MRAYIMHNKILMCGCLIISLWLTACGGGGNGSSNNIAYNGIRSQAIITQDNAQDLAFRAYTNSSSSLGIQVTGARNAPITSNASAGGRPYILLISERIKPVWNSVRSSGSSKILLIGTDLSGTEEMSGSCGGTATITTNINDETGDFSGNVQYESFCEAGIVVNGRVEFSGKINDNDELSINATFEQLTVRLCGESVTSTGELKMSMQIYSSTYSAEADMLVKNDNTGKIYWINDVAMNVTEGSTYTEITQSGRIYDPDYGYVQLTTESPVRIYDGDFWPSSGIILIEGDNGIAGGSTRAKMTMLNTSAYRIEADTDGDGFYDYDTVENWPDESLCIDTGGEGSFSSPIPISIDQSHRKTIAAEGTNYYSFVTENSGTYTIALTNVTPGVDLDWDILDSSGDTIDYCMNDLPSGDEVCSVSLSGNTRYILLVDNYDGEASFTIRIFAQ